MIDHMVSLGEITAPQSWWDNYRMHKKTVAHVLHATYLCNSFCRVQHFCGASWPSESTECITVTY